MSSSSCPSADALAAVVRGTGSAADNQHVARCVRCVRAVALLRRVLCAGIEPIGDAVSEVDHLVARLLDMPRSNWWKVVREPEFKRPDVARRLLGLALGARLNDPLLAVDFVQGSTTIANGLGSDTQDVRDLRFQAWKLSSVVLREAARYADTAKALEEAEAAADVASQPDLARASVFLSKALLYAEPDIWRPEEASTLIDCAEQILAEHDLSRMPTVLIARAFLLFRAGDMTGARDAFAALLAATPESDDENYLSALSNLTRARVELGEGDTEVERAIEFLIAKNVTLGRAVPAARAHWMKGRLHVIRGEYASATALLRLAMATIGDPDASIRVGVDLIEALLLDGQHREADDLAHELADVAVSLDQREPSRRHQLTAQVLAYLREAAERQAWTPDLVSDVARYLDRIVRQRPVDFIPPMSLAAM